MQLEAICLLCAKLVEQPSAHQLIAQLHQAWENLSQFAISLGIQTREFPCTIPPTTIPPTTIPPTTIPSTTALSTTQEAIGNLQRLSGQEREVFFAILCGKSVKEIAKDLNVSESTVRTYRARTLQKLEVQNTIELAKFAVRIGLT